MLPTRRPVMLPGQTGPASPATAAGSEPSGMPMPGQGGRVPPAPPMSGAPGAPPAAGGMPPGLQPDQPAVPPLPPPIQPTAGGPTSPMNIQSMLQPQQQAPGASQGQPQQPLPPWGGDGSGAPAPTPGAAGAPLGGGGAAPMPGGGLPPAPGAPATLPGAPPIGGPQAGAGSSGVGLMLRLMQAMGGLK